MKMQKNVTAMRSAAALLIASACLALAWGVSGRWREEHSGIPDAVSSRNENGECFLTVVANRDEIEDKEAFARMVVDMCLQNSFESMRLSTDLNGYPERLEIRVYSRKSAVGKEDPLCLIRLEPPAEDAEMKAVTDRTEYNIKDDREQYRLYVDGAG